MKKGGVISAKKAKLKHSFLNAIKESIIHLWLHKAETYIAVVQKGKGGAVTDHKFFADSFFKEDIRIFLFF